MSDLFEEARARSQAGARSSGAASATPQVYMGHSLFEQGQTSSPSSDQQRIMKDDILGIDSATTYFSTFAESEQKAMANKLYRAGLLDDPNDVFGAYAAWQDAVKFAADQYTFGGKRITPWDVIQTRIGIGRSTQARRLVPRTQTNTSSAVDVLTNGDANAMIQAMYQNELGRDPSSGELSRYRSMLINKTKANPRVTTTTTTGMPGGDSHTTSSTSGGYSSTALQGDLQHDVHADPEYGAYQAATSYMGAIQQLFSSSPDLTGPNG